MPESVFAENQVLIVSCLGKAIDRVRVESVKDDDDEFAVNAISLDLNPGNRETFIFFGYDREAPWKHRHPDPMTDAPTVGRNLSLTPTEQS